MFLNQQFNNYFRIFIVKRQRMMSIIYNVKEAVKMFRQIIEKKNCLEIILTIANFSKNPRSQ